jgi:protein TonB
MNTATTSKSTEGLAAVTLMLLMTALTPLAAEQLSTPPRGEQWLLKYEGGTEWIDEGTRLKVAVGPEQIVVETREGEAFSIPVSAITEVLYDPETQRHSTPIWNKVKRAWKGFGSLFGAFYKWGEYERGMAEYQRGLTDYYAAYQKARKANADYSHFFVSSDPELAAYFGPAVVAHLKVGTRPDRAYQRARRLRRELDGMEGVILPDPGRSLLVTAALSPVAAILSPFKKRKHFVHVFWEEDGEAREVALRVGKGKYANFLATLQRVTGKPWVEMAQRRQEMHQGLKREVEELMAACDGQPVSCTGARRFGSVYPGVLSADLDRSANYATPADSGFQPPQSYLPNPSTDSSRWRLRFSPLGQEETESLESLVDVTPPTEPVPLERFDPEYPELARRLDPGTIILRGVIRADGSVAGLEVTDGVHWAIDYVALSSLERWRFQPGQKNGAPVDVEVVVEIPFNQPDWQMAMGR